MDFGLARLMEEEQPDDDERPRTRDALICRRNQAAGKVRADFKSSERIVYALERFCITQLTGKPPFRAD